MDEDYIKLIIEKARSGLQVESTNIELKRKWWVLKKDLEEFVKDLAALANTHDGNSYVILGLDENGDIFDAPLPEDEASLQSRHKDKVEPPIETNFAEISVENKTISVINIPHSENRPHVIKKYKGHTNYIPIRFGTSTGTASRTDLDLMYKEGAEQSRVRVTLAEKELTWEKYAISRYVFPSFRVVLFINNYKSEKPDYIKVYLTAKSSDGLWKATNFIFQIPREEHLSQPNREYFIESGQKETISVFISSYDFHHHQPEPMPDFDKDTLQLIAETEGDKKFTIPIKPGWIKRG